MGRWRAGGNSPPSLLVGKAARRPATGIRTAPALYVAPLPTRQRIEAGCVAALSLPNNRLPKGAALPSTTTTLSVLPLIIRVIITTSRKPRGASLGCAMRRHYTPIHGANLHIVGVDAWIFFCSGVRGARGVVFGQDQVDEHPSHRALTPFFYRHAVRKLMSVAAVSDTLDDCKISCSWAGVWVLRPHLDEERSHVLKALGLLFDNAGSTMQEPPSSFLTTSSLHAWNLIPEI